MSLLRLCAFQKYRTARILFESNIRHILYSDQCHACLRIRNDSHRRIAEAPWTAFRRNYSAPIPKKEDGQKRVWEQSHLLDVLEARMQQLQSDVALDVKHSKVKLVRFRQPGREAPSKESHANKKGGGTDPPSQKHHPIRWIEKLKRERTNKAKKLQVHWQKPPDKLAEGKTSNASMKPPSTVMKTIPATKVSKGPVKLERSRLHTPHRKDLKQEHHKSGGAAAAAMTPDSKAHSREKQPAEVEELDHYLNQRTTAKANQLLTDREGNPHGYAQLNVRCYLESCVFSGDVERAQRCLLSHHNQVSRRKLLSIGAYNLMMRVWAKRGSLKQVGQLFSMVEEAGLQPNLCSYAAALECMGRSSSCSPRVIVRCLQQLEESGMSMDDLFQKCVFRQDEREFVLKAIQMVKPDFQPTLEMDRQICTSPLVEDIYTTRGSVKYPKLDFGLQELRERFSRQLSMELADTITIDSVETLKPVTKHMAKWYATPH
ncbi:hypothetical protein AGOR_G00146540 [Albula goreensis]|uniref:Uncharacterized protein n=1 Tax=Albula goreensis TaxID=1534307 RepID=A0A8T3D7W1_9TELE|nr:hypothetical protein AGOR_G00146540 [Albula goreensis]